MATVNQEAVVQEEQIVAFHLSDECYGIDIAVIQEIIRRQTVTQVPRTPEDIEGIINLRGRIVPILNLRSRLGLPATDYSTKSRVIVVALEEYTVGLEVDSVIGVLRLPENTIEKPSKLIDSIDADCVRGVGKHNDQLIILLNLHHVLRQEDALAA